MQSGLLPLILFTALLVALLVDWRFGEPPAMLHPVVWMGRYLKAVGQHSAPPASTSAQKLLPFVLGMLFWCAGAAIIFIFAASVQKYLLLLPAWAAALLLGLFLKPLLAWRMLYDEVLAVEVALAQSLVAGRKRLALLVSRDTADLSEAQVREAALESLAENLNDSVVAPVFWFVLLGLPGAALYRFANTADAMWGYRDVRNGQQWEWAGKWAARADDALSWLPARITAFLLALVAGGLPLPCLQGNANKTPSPNSGWPMAAMALALGVCLGKPGVYVLNPDGHWPKATDITKALRLAARTVVLMGWFAGLGWAALWWGGWLWSPP
ncbi:MAG: adenosylcobinamide-phosphate synthase CbiB [Burkholderiales bacterium]